ncbi:MAG: transposase [Pseudomonadales bacterium]|nr:transposase [Pseudomonadales bacterium]
MARPLRIEFSGALYHVTARGNARQNIYEDDQDRLAFLDALLSCTQTYHWQCHAYCLMSNHYHLLIETGDATLSKGMRHLNGTYSQLYNKRHKRVGHLLQGRYKAILVEKESYLLELARYIVLNPVRARMLHHADEWPWSSFRATAGLTPEPPFLTTEWILQAFGNTLSQSRTAFAQFIAEGNDQPSPWENLKNQIYLGSDQFVEQTQQYLQHGRKLKEIPAPQRLRPIKPLSHYQEAYNDRKEAMAKAWLEGHYTLTQIGEHFGCGRSTVNRAVNAFRGKWET